MFCKVLLFSLKNMQHQNQFAVGQKPCDDDWRLNA